jgi:signal transduction histidine kinase
MASESVPTKPSYLPSSSHLNRKGNRKGSASLEDILITQVLDSRPLRFPNPGKESKALRQLSRVMANSPEDLPDTLLRLALELCHAGTAGLSLVETIPNGEQVFRWTNLAGRLRAHVGGFTPRGFSPCGVSLDSNSPKLFSFPGRHFQYLNKIDVPIVEALVIPLVGEIPLGTIWILSHDESTHFDAEDVRIMTSLAEFTTSALLMIQLLNAEQSARRNAETRLEDTVIALREQVAERTRTEENLRQLTGRLVQLRDDERRRLARELHDSVGQLLAAMSMNQANVLADKQLSPMVASAVSENAALLAQVSTEIRTISHLLHPPLLDEVGLAFGIRGYLEGFAERSRMKVDLELADDFGRLPLALETAIFRIVQECLTNIHRHSESATAKIRVTRSSKHICLEVADKGKGMPPEKLWEIEMGTSGVGLRGMRERIRLFGGSLEIHSDSTGTTVTARFPFEDNLMDIQSQCG